MGNRYAGEWPREQFRKHGVEYRPSDPAKSDIYRELLAPLNSGRIELLDNRRLIAQLCALERRTARGGRDSIDHPPNAHDDLINAAAGALTQSLRAGDQVFPELNEAVHNLDRYVNPADEYKWAEFCRPLKKYSAISHSITTTAFLQMAIDRSGNLFALDESYRVNTLIKDNALVIRNLIARYGKQECTLLHPGSEDASTSDEVLSIQLAYSREQVRALPARKAAVGVGIDLIKEHLRIDRNRSNTFTREPGSPRLFISRQRCPHLWREMIALKLATEDGRIRYIGSDCAVSNLRNILMRRPNLPASEKDQEPHSGYVSAWS